jgi:BirA family biotin operon repressor/biotin-[acetyl-CoA-carboxylase] ligase
MKRELLEKTADGLIAHLRKKSERYEKWDKLTARFDTDRETLCRAIELAAQWGYKFRVRMSLGAAFVAPPDVLSATELPHGLKTNWLGRPIYSYQSVKSTNDTAVKLVAKGAQEGAIITADEQRQGRGRLGRKWFSPPGTGIYLSIVLKPPFLPEDAPGLAIMTAVALADTLAVIRPGKVQIKWPNDIWINGRKVAGILTELSADRDKIHYVIVGVGINVNQRAADFPDDIRGIATSVRRELKRRILRVDLTQRFLCNFEKEYETYIRYRLKKSHRKIRKYSALIGKEVTLKLGRSSRTGLVKDIDKDGCLILQTAQGREKITAGEVTVAKE